MSNLSAFMHANVEQIENYKFAASPRFKGEDGKPMLWEICCISADEYARIRSAWCPAKRASTPSSLIATLSRPRCAPAARCSRT